MFRLRMPVWALIAVLLAVALTAAACGGDDDAAPEDFTGQTLTVITHDSFVISEETIEAFETEFGVTVELLPTGDAVEALNRAILTKNNPEGDLLFGVDNVSFVRALEQDLFIEYESPALAGVDDRWLFDDSGRITPVDYGYVLFNYQKAALDEAGLAPPARLEDLIEAEWQGRVAVEDPNTSSPGQQLMLATIAYFGEDGWLDWWQSMRDNDLIVASGWEGAYYVEFAQYGGDAWLVNSYATSPAAEVIFAETELDESPTANVLIDGASYRQVEGVGILQNAEHVALAKEFIDFMLSRLFQEDIPLNMFVYPVLNAAALPQEFADFADVPETVAQIDPDRVAEKLEDWLDQWTDTVVR